MKNWQQVQIYKLPTVYSGIIKKNYLLITINDQWVNYLVSGRTFTFVL